MWQQIHINLNFREHCAMLTNVGGREQLPQRQAVGLWGSVTANRAGASSETLKEL